VQERSELVSGLVRTGPLSSTELERLHSFGLDGDVTLAVLSAADARAILSRQVNGELSIDYVLNAMATA
jgi:hypothetical protein